MPEPMTKAEQAAAEAIAAVRNENGYGGIEHFAASDWEDEARAVVAAVRPLLLDEAAEAMLHHAQAAENNDATEDAVYTFMVAADRIRAWAAALRTTTSEEK